MAAKPAAVGTFVLGALALAVAAIVFFGGTGLFTRTVRVVAFFNGSLAGLDVGAPVTFRGVRLGAVQSIGLRFSSESMSAEIPVYMDLDPSHVEWSGSTKDARPGLQRFVAAGLRAQLAPQSIVTGQLRVDLEFRPNTPARLVGSDPDTPEIPAVTSDLDTLRNEITQLPLRDLADTAQKTLLSLNRLSDRLDTLAGPLADRTGQTAAATTDAMRAATATLQTANAAIQQLQTEASQTMQQFNATLADARQQLNGRGGDLARLLAGATRTVQQAQTTLASVNDLASPRSRFRGDLDAALRDLAASASSLRSFARELERNPSAILTGRRP